MITNFQRKAFSYAKRLLAKTPEGAKQQETRQPFKFGFSPLEERVVLDADFSFDGSSLDLFNYSSLGAESLVVSEFATDFKFALNEGIWNGVNGGGAAGAGTGILTVSKTAFAADSQVVSDGTGIDLSFSEVHFSDSTLSRVDFIAGDVTQTGAIQFDAGTFSISGSVVELTDVDNDFGTIEIESTAQAEIVDSTAIDIGSATAADQIFVQADSILLSGDVSVENKVFLSSNNGIGQVGGILNTSALLVSAGESVSLNLENELGSAGNAGQIAAVVSSGDFQFRNRLGVELADLDYERISGTTESVVGIDVAGDVGLHADSIEQTSLLFNASSILLESQNGFESKSPLEADELILKGSGFFKLGEANKIQRLAASIDGDLAISNRVDLGFTSIELFGVVQNGLMITGDLSVDTNQLETENGLLLWGWDSTQNYPQDRAFVKFDENGDWEVLFETGKDSSTNGIAFGNGRIYFTGFLGSGATQRSGLFSSDLNGNIEYISGFRGQNLAWARGDLYALRLNGFYDGDEIYRIDLENGNDELVYTFTTAICCNNAFSYNPENGLFYTGNSGLNYGLFSIDVFGTGEEREVANPAGGSRVTGLAIGDGLAYASASNGSTFRYDLSHEFGTWEDIDTGKYRNRSAGYIYDEGSNVWQSAAIEVGGVSSFDLAGGWGLLDHEQNDLNSIEIVSSFEFMLRDANALSILSAKGVNLTFQTGSSIELNGDVTARQTVSFSAHGLDQVSGIVETSSLILTGSGAFDLNSSNNIGRDDTGSLSVEIVDGDLSLTNENEIVFSGTASVQAGTNFAGNLTIATTDDDIKQASDTPLIVTGNAIFDVGTGNVCLEFGDSNGDGINDNDLNRLTILSASSAEIVDSNSISILDSNLGGTLLVEAEGLGDILLDGAIQADNGLLFLAGNDIQQAIGGVVATKTLLLVAGGDAVLGELNDIGLGSVGILAGRSGGEWFVTNQNAIRVANVTFTRKDGSVIDYDGLSSDKVHIISLNVFLDAEVTSTNTIVIESENGISQGGGALIANSLVLVGEGDFLLTEENRIGTADQAGKISAIIAGSLELKNRYALTAAEITCGTTVFTGVNIATGGIYSGDITLDTSATNGDLMQEEEIPFIAEGITRINVGTGNICLNQGDSNGDSITNNRLSTIFIQSATSVEIASFTDVTAERLVLTEQLSIQSGGLLTLNDDVDVERMRLSAGAGLLQAQNTIITTQELLLSGAGDFRLGERNRIGDSFSAGQFTADLDGSLNLQNEFDILIDKLTYTFKDGTTTSATGVRIGKGSSSGNFTLITSNDDVAQTAAGSVVVAGLASFNVGSACITLGEAAANDFGTVQVIDSDAVEILDGVGQMTLDEIRADDQAWISGLSILTNDVIDVGDRLALIANSGVTQIGSSSIIAEELLLQGSGEFRLNGANRIQDAFGKGRIAAEVDGEILFQNGYDIEIAALGFHRKDGITIDLVGVDVVGDFRLEAIDMDVTQGDGAAVVIGGTASFELGIGCLNLVFGDESGDSINDNDLNGLAIVSAAVVDVADSNGFVIDDSMISDRARFESGGKMIIDRDLRVANSVFFVGSDGLNQSRRAKLVANNLLVSGSGDFVLDQLNSIGDRSIPGQVAALVDGSLSLKNNFGINVASLSYLNKDATTVTIVGVQMNDTSGAGNLTIDVNNSDVTQSVDSPVIAKGLTTLDAGENGNVNLVFSDTIADEESVNENDFNTLVVNGANTVEINDGNAITIDGIFANDQVALSSDTDEIRLTGNVSAANLVKFHAAEGMAQDDGVIKTSGLLLTGEGYFDLATHNQLGAHLGIGNFAANVSGDINFVNSNKIAVSSVRYTDLAGNATTAIGVGGFRLATLDNFRLKADGISLQQRTVADTVVFETSSGIKQFNTQTTDGIIESKELSLSGTGVVDLMDQNRIGSGLSSGNLAIDYTGNIRLKNLFGVAFDAVTFEFKDNSLRTDKGVNIDEIGGAQGNFQLETGGDISDAANIEINVQGRASLIANNGNSDIRLGDEFSTTGGPDNITRFGTIGLKANDASIHVDSTLNMDGVRLTGDLDVSAFGDIVQTGDDPFSAVGTHAIEVGGNAKFLTDALWRPDDHFNDAFGQDILLLDRNNLEVLDNIFAGDVEISGSATTGTLHGNGTLRNVEFRNSKFEDVVFPRIDSSSDPLRTLKVWAPNSSLEIAQDIDVLGSASFYSGVDSTNGSVGGSLGVTNRLINRKITDTSGVSIKVGRSATFEAGNTIVLANHFTNELKVGQRLQTSTHGGDAGSRVRVGIANNAVRGTDSDAEVNVGQLRFRVKQTNLANSEHASFNIDNAVEITGYNVARSLMLVADGNITDNDNTKINVKNSTTLIAEREGDILLGESFSTNFIDNNVDNFGALSVRARNANITEDSAILLDGIRVTGNLSITAKGHIRQSGLDRYGQVGTPFIEVDGDATFRVDRELLPSDQLNDKVGQDVRIMTNLSRTLMDNLFKGETIITTTDFDNSNNQRGSLRNVEFRNVSETARDPIFQLANSDKIRNLVIWTPQSSLKIRNNLRISNDFRVYAGVDARDHLSTGRLYITDRLNVRNITDRNGVSIRVGGNLEMRAANRLKLVDTKTDALRVAAKSTFITLGGRLGNEVRVGASRSGGRGTDSGGIFETKTLKYRAPVKGEFGLVTIIADKPMTVINDSLARSVFLED